MAFFKCLKCKKVWQYPIEKCPDCSSALEKLESRKAKVIGISRVSISSIFHKKTPYFVLVLEDQNGNRWVQKSFKEYKIGDEFKVESGEDKKGVAIWRIKYDFSETIKKVIELIGGLKINKHTKILILPTLVIASHSYLCDNASPEFLDTILKFLFGTGVKPENVKVCAQSFDEVEIGAKAQKSGLLEVCQKQKVTPFDLAQGNFVKKGNLEVSEEVFKADFVLNLPILKIGRASASENLFFLLKKENYLSQKYLSSEKEIFKNLKNNLPECLTIAEADRVQGKEGFVQYLGLAFSSFNSQHLDRVFSKITEEEKIPEILKEIKIEEIPILGRKIEEVAI